MINAFLHLKKWEALQEWVNTHPEEVSRICRESMKWEKIMFGKKNNEMPELKGGMLVKLADGRCALMCDKDTGWHVHLINSNVFLHLCIKINADDVVEIYPGNVVYAVLENNRDISLQLIWKREEVVKEMTVEEIEKALGHKVKVVGNDC